MELRELQLMFSSIVSGENGLNIGELQKIITGGGTLNPKKSIDVYIQDYQARMKDALSKNYEATWLIMGDDEFFEYTEIFIKKYPSNLSNLTNYGEYFSELIAENDELADASQMALFERAFWKNFHSNDRPAIIIDEKMITEGLFDLSNFTFLKSQMRLDLVWMNRDKGINALDGLEIFEESYFIIYKAAGT